MYCRNDLGGRYITRLVAKLIVSKLTPDPDAYMRLQAAANTRQILFELAERVKCDFVSENIDDVEIREENLEELCYIIGIGVSGSLTITRQEFESSCTSIFNHFREAATLFKSV